MRLSSLTVLLASAALACGDAGPDNGFEWQHTTAASVGLDQARLDAMRAHIEGSLPNVNAVVIVRGGQVAFQWYALNRDGYYPYDTHSITKSWVATFIGIGLQEGWIGSLDDPLTIYFPEVFDDPGIDPRLANVTIRHLMTMSSGIEDEQTNRFPAGTEDFVNKLLHVPLLHDPGSRFLYDGTQPHILSGLITRVRGRNLADLGREGLFADMNISRGQWHHDRDGVNNGGTALIMSALDLAKLGELYLRDGVWQGTRYLPPGFAEAVAGTVSFPLENSFADYASLWWTTDQYGELMWIAAGFRGQLVVVMPALDIVVVVQQESYELRGELRPTLPLITNYVIPAAR
ncbi:MAG: serine hydrolase [Gemmatimonadales bacterium]